MSREERVEIIEPLRGLAAFAVMWFHFTDQSLLFKDAQGAAAWVKSSGSLGWLGVEVFFVISGFILPYSMYRRGYASRNLGTFVAKRIVRLDPPYLVNIVMALALWFLVSQVPSFRGEPFTFEPARFLCHLGYLNAIVGYGWYNPVYWTLAIEFQYYLLLALIYPLLVCRARFVRVGFPIALSLVAFILPQETLIFHWLGLFAIGMAIFQWYCGLTSTPALCAVLGVLNWVCWATLGPLVAAVGLVTGIVIATRPLPRIGPLSFLGSISYSLYLVHVPLGSRFLNIGSRFASSLIEQLVVLWTTILITIWAAHLLYQWVEKPAQRWSSAIGYRGDPAGESAREGPVDARSPSS